MSRQAKPCQEAFCPLTRTESKGYIIVTNPDIADKYLDKPDALSFDISEIAVVYPDAIRQYTGLKDINGKDIITCEPEHIRQLIDKLKSDFDSYVNQTIIQRTGMEAPVFNMKMPMSDCQLLPAKDREHAVSLTAFETAPADRTQ